MPAVDIKTGKIILSDRNDVFEAPNGNGGIYKALNDSGMIHKMINNKIEYI